MQSLGSGHQDVRQRQNVVSCMSLLQMINRALRGSIFCKSEDCNLNQPPSPEPVPAVEGPLAALSAVRALIREWIIPFYALAGVVGLLLYGLLIVDPTRLLATRLLLGLAVVWAIMLIAKRNRRAAGSALLSKTALIFVGLMLLMYSIGLGFTGVARSVRVDPSPVAAERATPAAADSGPAASTVRGADALSTPTSATVQTNLSAPVNPATALPAPRPDQLVQRRPAAAAPDVLPSVTQVAPPAGARPTSRDAPMTQQAPSADPACGRFLLKLSLGETLDAAEQTLLRACRAKQ